MTYDKAHELQKSSRVTANFKVTTKVKSYDKSRELRQMPRYRTKLRELVTFDVTFNDLKLVFLTIKLILSILKVLPCYIK